ncbi:hypothetical protein AQUCO_00201085v1 [Aquilegia coerulea]|uniref:Uncharacterized protein n=1 Tax=Aquilegia coerulea TaxID=218851 RepID=A0A2G5F6B9_AQUCA|nr:hypothetical protein AQUCO_00201085v1 [Aquilegia coerulea]PIA63490.1 hypothetical protein AQUCO_00201085v1 [Aquilegia coerulea]
MGFSAIFPSSSSSSSSSSSLFVSNNNHHCVLRPCDVFSFVGSSSPFLSFGISRQRRVCLSASIAEKKLEFSWLTPDRNDDYGGWAIVETQTEEKMDQKKKKGFNSYFLLGTGVSAVILVAALSYSSFTRKGLKLNSNGPSNVLQRLLTPFSSVANISESSDSSMSNANSVGSEPVSEYEETIETSASESVEKLPRLVNSTVADSTQEEALLLLKKLKIIDYDVKADELCTRREYARWLIKTNSALERNPRYQISMPPAGSVQAFDDVNTEDPDFRFIQALAEAGIVLSKLSDKNDSSDLDGPEVKEIVNFYPESYISRLDLINWKAQLEYACMPRIQEISTKKVGFMDVSTISQEASSELFMDMLAGDKSILRRVFGRSRRFQPQKPATKPQAAVALTSGRMAEAIHTELLRLEAEYASMLAEMEEIRSELLLRGEIQQLWEEKLNEVKSYGQEVARHFNAAISDLEQARKLRDKSLSENLKERAALDCQRKLLLNLKEEVNEMSEKLTCERADFAAQQKNLKDMSIEFRTKQDAVFEAKSILEAEKEAVQMLRSWVEDEARRNQARAQVLEKVGRRWKWNEEA